jgi:hypothetical protein
VVCGVESEVVVVARRSVAVCCGCAVQIGG